TMAIRLTMISHARTSAQPGAYFPTDEPIADRNIIARSKAISQSLRRVDQAWTAPELRTRQTAEALGLTFVIARILSDCDYGSWRGLKLSDIQARDSKGLGAWISDAGASPHSGETILNVLDRVSA